MITHTWVDLRGVTRALLASRWTFQAKVIHKTMLPRYAAVHLTGLGLNSVLVWLPMYAGLFYEPTMPVAALLVAVSTYLLCKHFVFQNASAGKYA
ncbi:MAG: GtrA family protein [Desulfovibrio sp.]|jgi:putative flippase GtrA|nr:GtrA family protein [Desulfovibrio sp.]